MQSTVSHAQDRLARLEGYLLQDPHNQPLLVEAFQCAFETGRFEAAQRHLDQALAQQPQDTGLRHAQATLWIAQQRLDEAQAMLESLLAAGESAPAIVFNLGFVQFRRQQYTVALEQWLKLWGQPEAPAQTAAYILRCHHHLRDFAAGQAFLAKLSQAGMLDAAVCGVAALMRLDANDLTDAKHWAEQALAHDPGQIEALVARGSIALAEQDTVSAKTLLERAVAQGPNEGRVWTALGMASLLEQAYDRALAQFSRATTLIPGHIGTWHGKAWTHIARGEWEAAQRDFETALELDRNFGESHGGLAVALARQGHAGAARDAAARALRLDPQNLSARYAEAILQGIADDPATFRRFAARVLAKRTRADGTTLDDLLQPRAATGNRS